MNEKTHPGSTDQALMELTQTLLYEGYALYPYRHSALKNKTPVPFGIVYPKEYAAHNSYVHSSMQTECLLVANAAAAVDVCIKFLQIDHSAENNTGGEWTATERVIETGTLQIQNLLEDGLVIEISYPCSWESMFLPGGSLTGKLNISARPVESLKGGFRIKAIIENITQLHNAASISNHDALKLAFVSTHTILRTSGAQFISAQDPPAALKTIVDHCVNRHTWPVLIDEDDTTMLSSPIILYDHPQVNGASIGDMFDGTEMEEALLLHVNVLTHKEKQELMQEDDKLKAMMSKVGKATPEHIISLHDKMKNSTKNIFGNEIR